MAVLRLPWAWLEQQELLGAGVAVEEPRSAAVGVVLHPPRVAGEAVNAILQLRDGESLEAGRDLFPRAQPRLRLDSRPVVLENVGDYRISGPLTYTGTFVRVPWRYFTRRVYSRVSGVVTPIRRNL